MAPDQQLIVTALLSLLAGGLFGFGFALNGFHWRTTKTVTGYVRFNEKELYETYRKGRREITQKAIEHSSGDRKIALSELKAIGYIWSNGFKKGHIYTVRQMESEVDRRCKQEKVS